ncbi:HepT-like ribonuclease domain-containing protein [Microtetraspora malaysiensis]|uniref:HepT-like ribonuclease domain-containing protein n=1 Tax=Microtetraspora malaysiensis TaxID=161358 RepID=UPI003D8F53DC
MPRDPRRDSLYLTDIVSACRTVRRWIGSYGVEWSDDEILQNAVLRQLMVIGEASACLSEDVRATVPVIPWREIRGFRNQAVRAYFSLDWAIVQEVVDVNLPDLERHALTMLMARYPDVAAEFESREPRL